MCCTPQRSNGCLTIIGQPAIKKTDVTNRHTAWNSSKPAPGGSVRFQIVEEALCHDKADSARSGGESPKFMRPRNALHNYRNQVSNPIKWDVSKNVGSRIHNTFPIRYAAARWEFS